MLLEIRPDTARSAIFMALNNELGYFLHACVSAGRFGKGLFSIELRDSIYGNTDTKDKFKALWDTIRPLSAADRKNILNEYNNCQFIQHYYDDKTYPFPIFPDSVHDAIENLTKHLFSKTTDLAGIKTACSETLHQHFNNFCTVNSNVCCFCGSSELTQVRAGVGVNNQWRAANDHLLAKKDYPVFAIHPDNLIPICEICNSKAKLAKDLLNIKKKNHPDVRRLCFFPFIEHCNNYVGVEVTQEDLKLTTQCTMIVTDPEIQEKLDTWNDVYRIKERVEGKFTDLVVLADNDCPADSLNEFKQRIKRKAARCKTYCRLEAWNFWKFLLYEWLDNNTGIVEELWESIIDKRSDADNNAIYEI